jgi:hypothetical protein
MEEKKVEREAGRNFDKFVWKKCFSVSEYHRQKPGKPY